MIKQRIAFYFSIYAQGRDIVGLGGAERRLGYLLSHLNPDRYEVSVLICAACSNEKVYELIGRYIASPQQVIIYHNYAGIIRHIVKAKYDVICYLSSILSAKPCILGARLAGSRKIVMMVGPESSKWKFDSQIRKVLLLPNILAADYIDCLYPAGTPILRTHFPHKAVTTTPCSLPRLSSFLESNGLSEKNILFAARLSDEKNPVLFVRSIARIQKEIRNSGYSVMMCGIGPLEPVIRRTVQETGCSDLIRICGYQNMEEVISRARIFCSLQKYENYPSQSLLEAIASGCYCIATNVGDTRQIVKEGFGLLVKEDEKSVSDAIEALLWKEAAFFAECSRNAREFASQNFDPLNAIRYYESILSNLQIKEY